MALLSVTAAAILLSCIPLRTTPMRTTLPLALSLCLASYLVPFDPAPGCSYDGWLCLMSRNVRDPAVLMAMHLMVPQHPGVMR